MKNLTDGLHEEQEAFRKVMEDDDVYVSPQADKAPDKADQPAWQKDLDKDTVVNNCDATNCKYFNEGFRGSCMLNYIEISPQAGCKQYSPKDEVKPESDEPFVNKAPTDDGCKNYNDGNDVCLDDVAEAMKLANSIE